jgi:hypothetical protein
MAKQPSLKNNVVNVKARIAEEQEQQAAKAEKAEAQLAQLSPLDQVGKKIVDAVRQARNNGTLSASSFAPKAKADGTHIFEATFANDKGTLITLRSVQREGAKIPSYELALRSGEKVQMFKGKYARESWTIAHKELSGRKAKTQLSESDVQEVSSWF